MIRPTRTVHQLLRTSGRRLMVMLSLLLVTGCTAVVTPPDTPEQPVTVHLVDNAYHAAVVLPGPDDGTWTRYEYGDWNYFARNQTGFFHSFAAYAWPTDGALGRRFMDRPKDLHPDARVDGTHVYELRVPRGRVKKLMDALNNAFQKQGVETYVNHRRDLTLVRVDDGYWMFHDSNAQVVDWLERLGCEVHGSSFLSNWHVNRN